jgi:SAM-dependent methyltransferase
MSTVMWGQDVAAAYDVSSAYMFDPSVLTPTVDRLDELANGGLALEFAIGTGRVALPLRERGVAVSGIELSPHMVDQLRQKEGSQDIPIVMGDMAQARAEGEFSLVYLVYNTIMNLTTQEEQVAVFINAAAHLRPGGGFVVECVVPQLRKLPPGELGRVFTLQPDHVGLETFDDQVGQVSWSHHWMTVNDKLVQHSAPYRYVWPSELDLMARIGGLTLAQRWGGWNREPFTNDSTSHVSVWRRMPLS